MSADEFGVDQEQWNKVVEMIERCSDQVVRKFGYLQMHRVEGGWCTHVFRDRSLGCVSPTIIEGLLHVYDNHDPGELEPEQHELKGPENGDES